MRSLFLAAVILASAPLHAAAAASPVADWRQDKLNTPMQEALRGAGYRLEDDGRVLGPDTRAPLTETQLGMALRKLGLSTQRLALERLRVMLDDKSMSPADQASLRALKGNLPPEVADALDDHTGTSALKALADRDIAQIAAYFDGGRRLAERLDDARPVRAAVPGPRSPLPYFAASEQRLGGALQAAALRQIGRDPFGRKVLARLNGKNGKPLLPPIVVDDLTGDAARYDYRRHALIVDRQMLISAATDGVSAAQRGALEKTLTQRAALIDHLNAHPQALASFAAKNDALLVHELTHAWQDRREPVMREMARGNLPAAVVVDYEEEAWITKNLYLQSKLTHSPASVEDDGEFMDDRRMLANPTAWRTALRLNYAGSDADAMDFGTANAIQDRRLEMARLRRVKNERQQISKDLDVAALERAEKELSSSEAGEEPRLARLQAAIELARPGSRALIASYYIGAARRARNATDFDVRIHKAIFYAAKSGDAALLAKARAEKGPGK